MRSALFALPLLCVLLAGSGVLANETGNANAAAADEGAQRKLPNQLAEELLRLRDPFKRMVEGSEIKVAEEKSPLEKFAATAFKLVGIQTGPGRGRAVLVDPEGATHIVGEKAKIGLNKGFVFRIAQDKLVVKERVHNIFGQLEEITTFLELQPESKALAKSGNNGPAQVSEVLSGPAPVQPGGGVGVGGTEMNGAGGNGYSQPIGVQGQGMDSNMGMGTGMGMGMGLPVDAAQPVAPQGVPSQSQLSNSPPR